MCKNRKEVVDFSKTHVVVLLLEYKLTKPDELNVRDTKTVSKNCNITSYNLIKKCKSISKMEYRTS